MDGNGPVITRQVGVRRLAGFYNNTELIIPLPNNHGLGEENLQQLVEACATLRDQMIRACRPDR